MTVSSRSGRLDGCGRLEAAVVSQNCPDDVDETSGEAEHAGRKWLRLDAWRTNTALHDYYRRHGFADVSTISLPWRGSGALFQRPAQPSP